MKKKSKHLINLELLIDIMSCSPSSLSEDEIIYLQAAVQVFLKKFLIKNGWDIKDD